MWAYHSSEISWCEADYNTTEYIVEFYNTISNFPFLIISPLMIYKYRSYIENVSGDVQILYILLFFIGLSSIYFHATLSFAGQILDELGILYFTIASFTTYYEYKFSKKIFMIAIFGTILCFIAPKLNAILLFLFLIPGIYSFIYTAVKYDDPQLSFIGGMSLLFVIIGLACWFVDRVYCDYWQSNDYPQFHAWWHLFILISGIFGIAFLAMLKKVERVRKIVKYDLEVGGMPYILVDMKDS